MPERTVNQVFDRVVLVNLDRRADRLESVAAQLGHLGIVFERFSAVDGRTPDVEREWRAYAESEPVRLPVGMRPVDDYREFYCDYDGELARIAFIEAKEGRKAIATAGAWGLLASMTAVIERALAEGWQSLLVLEDDVLWHRDTLSLFDHCVAEAPPDWQILQLGAMQLHWGSDWISWHSDHLYRCGGSSIGAHAFGIRRSVMPLLLERCRGRDLPFDIGALHSAKRAFADRCFTAFPNLVIQDAGDSEIGMSRLFFREARKVDNVYRWNLPDYGMGALLAGEAPDPGPAPPVEADRRVGDPAIEQVSPPVGRGRLGALLARATLLPWPRSGAAAKHDTPQPAAKGKPSPARRHLGGQPPLRAHAKRRAKSHAVIAVAIGMERDALVRVLDSLRASRARTDAEPILITDSDETELFRDRDLVFEYLPPRTLHQRFAPDLDWNLYLLRRLAILRRKWQPKRIVTFGPAARELLDAWRASPFEDDSIHQVAGGVRMAPEER